MSTTAWFILIGCLMLARGLGADGIARLPLTSAMAYLGVGLLLGPMFLGLFSFDLVRQAPLLETLTEIAVLISLFSAGVKMPVPFSLARWLPSLRLAWLSMAISVALVAAFSCLVLGLPLGAGILLGAILAPTDPVLATDVQLRHAGDREQLRFMLTSEAGMNDGSGFPIVMLGLGLLGLHELGPHGVTWLWRDLVWASAGAIALGAAGGALLAWLGWQVRAKEPKHAMLDDLAALGLIALVYGVSTWLHAWGFLAVFFAGVALRQTELRLAGAPKDRHGLLQAEETHAVSAAKPRDSDVTLTVSGESLVFKEHLERLSELTLVLLLGGAVTAAAWSWQAWSVALFLLLVARPASVMLGLLASGTSVRLRGLAAWFGVRGIGSLYYLSYAIAHGLADGLARELADITLVVVILSIVAHGLTVKPLLERYWRK
ncbi:MULTISPECIES: sodium:proton antiporter [unclassified Janthinobacterium]|uniref:cation:proton antiporter n=1 Tax=unclassified Janthinobacterium TaxID=2610881 RepID=UPI001E2E10F6|nr:MULTISPECIES: cation:proton antiporter [unclassified Janthinobacterium]MCC7642597.1 cation:proton antiporter [Janthinobacterium sp. EB271-G4-3-1]MCC7689830.1 cation:proton antiporter [Janthinobacterium sp. EB271-G4-3-2]